VEIDCIAAVVCDENTYYNNKDAVRYIYWFYYYKKGGNFFVPYRAQDEYCWEIKADKNGKVLSDREYIAQPSRVPSGRPLIQIKSGKLPGVE
jgi:hypothetical protein